MYWYVHGEVANVSLSSQMHPIKTGSFSTCPPPPSPPLIWQSLCNLGLKWLFLKMPWALGSWYFPLITVPHYHHKALSTSLVLLITLFWLPWHILSLADALCQHINAWVRKKEVKGRESTATPSPLPPLSLSNVLIKEILQVLSKLVLKALTAAAE